MVEHARALTGFRGAFTHGSINGLPGDALLPETSDVDVVVVLADPEPPPKPGKLVHRDVLLDVSYLPEHRLSSAEQVLAQYELARSLATPSLLLDPSGELSKLQVAVSRDYARRPWVRARCEGARAKVLAGLERLNESDPFYVQVIIWLFATGVTTHVLLVAGLWNPTVRRRYDLARALLAEYGQLEFHETLLEHLGCARMTRARVEQHVDALAGVFDATKSIVRTPFPFASDLSEIARPIAIDGSRALIDRGQHREAVFWIVATYSRCMAALHQDGPAGMGDRFDPGYQRLLADLGIQSPADLARSRRRVEGLLPQVWEVAEAIMAANPAMEE